MAIAQVDGKWPNLALAKIASVMKREGNTVGWFSPLEGADIVFASKTFVETPDDPYLPPDAVRGGSGYSLSDRLMDFVETAKPDWSLWPWWGEDMGFTTRGCIRRCPFCIVPEKEGKLRVVAEFADVSTGRDEMVLLDANLTAAPIEHFRAVCADATKAGVRLDFTQGLDARLLTDEHAAVLRDTRTTQSIHMAFDHVREEPAVRAAVATMQRAGWPASRLMFYVLIGYDSTPEEDMYRVELLRSLGCDPFAMKFKRDDRYQMDFARWVNRKELFKSCTFDEYRKGLGRQGVPLSAC